MPVCSHAVVLDSALYPIEESAQKDQLESFLKSSTAFYLSLVESIEEKYGFQVATVLAGKANFNSKTHLRTVSSSSNLSIIVKLGTVNVSVSWPPSFNSFELYSAALSPLSLNSAAGN